MPPGPGEQNTKTNDVKNYFFNEGGIGTAFPLIILYLLAKPAFVYMLRGRLQISDLRLKRVATTTEINQRNRALFDRQY